MITLIDAVRSIDASDEVLGLQTEDGGRKIGGKQLIDGRVWPEGVGMELGLEEIIDEMNQSKTSKRNRSSQKLEGEGEVEDLEKERDGTEVLSRDELLERAQYGGRSGYFITHTRGRSNGGE